MLKTACELFLCFVLFSFVGWIIETLLYILRDRKVVKRGFLFGPVCPIYGCGALIATLIYKMDITRPFWVFIFGMVLCGLMEYITHFVMEKAFKAMWWDYSDRMFNIKGRVYLKGLLFFGAGILIYVRLVLPIIYHVMDIMPEWLLYLLTFVTYTIIIIDVTTTVADLKDTVKSIKRILNTAISESQESLDTVTGVISTKVDKTKANIKEKQSLNTIMNSIKTEHTALSRIKKKYPNFDLKKYKEELAWYFGPEADEKGKDGIELHGTGGLITKDDDNTDESA